MNEPLPSPASAPLAVRLPQRLGRRLAALGLVGAMMVALPLVQLLRYQNAEINSLQADRVGIDPVARAVDLQRGLLAHRDASSLVLLGRAAAEPERKVRQREVDDRIASLAVALVSGQWERAVHEADALHEDWSLLAQQIGIAAVSADESDQAHRLLIEQTLQVIDLVADSATPHAAAAPDGRSVRPALAVVHALPRLAWQTALLAAPAATGAQRQQQLASAEAGLARLLGGLNAALARQAQPALEAAGASAGAATDRYLHLLAAAAPGSDDTAALRAAAAAALQSQFALFQQARGDAAARLEARLDAAQGRRAGVLAAMTALFVLAAGLALSLVRALRAPAPLPAPPPAQAPAHAAEPPGPERQSEVVSLLKRLRESQSRGEVDLPSSQFPEHHPTLPGRL